MVKVKKTPTELFLEGWDALGIGRGDMTFEYRFHPTRRWRWDIAFPASLVSIELNGRGRHQTVIGTRRDNEKSNYGTLAGWAVLQLAVPDLTGKTPEGDSLLGEFLENILVPILNQRYEQDRVLKQVEQLQELPPPQGSKKARCLQRKNPSGSSTGGGSTG